MFHFYSSASLLYLHNYFSCKIVFRCFVNHSSHSSLFIFFWSHMCGTLALWEHSLQDCIIYLMWPSKLIKVNLYFHLEAWHTLLVFSSVFGVNTEIFKGDKLYLLQKADDLVSDTSISMVSFSDRFILAIILQYHIFVLDNYRIHSITA